MDLWQVYFCSWEVRPVRDCDEPATSAGFYSHQTWCWAFPPVAHHKDTLAMEIPFSQHQDHINIVTVCPSIYYSPSNYEAKIASKILVALFVFLGPLNANHKMSNRGQREAKESRGAGEPWLENVVTTITGANSRQKWIRMRADLLQTTVASLNKTLIQKRMKGYRQLS